MDIYMYTSAIAKLSCQSFAIADKSFAYFPPKLFFLPGTAAQEKLQRKTLAPLDIMEAQLKARLKPPLKPLEHHGTMVSRGISGALN